MTLAPLLAAPFAVKLHVFTVVPAFFLGTWLIFFSRKGARRHRAVGYVYLTLMTVTAITALWIHQIPAIDIVYGFGPIHIFSVVTLSGVVGALRGAWTHNIKMHRLHAGRLYRRPADRRHLRLSARPHHACAGV